MTLDRLLLFPYYLVLKLRSRRYRGENRKFYVPEVPSICVGNVTVGGTGKTPHVEMILRILKESEAWKGRNLAVLSRGYKRESTGFQQVTIDGSAESFGDEPLQIKKKFPDVTVVVDKDRVEGCNILCHPDKLSSSRYAKCWNKEFPPAEYIVLDDAFQYRKLKAARTVVLTDYTHPAHRDSLLPLGRLRDLKERIFETDVIIVSNCPEGMENDAKAAFASQMGISDYSWENCTGTSPEGRRITILFTYIAYGPLDIVYKEADMRYAYAKKVILLTGIAHDTALRKVLSDSHKIVRRFSFPDHHKYRWADINKVRAALRKNPTAAIVTTEKDKQRLLDFKGMPVEIRERLLSAPIEIRFTSEGEQSVFNDIIVNI